jgi:hypothetical protein
MGIRRCIFKLLQRNLEENTLNTIEQDLRRLVRNYQGIFGESSMVSNIHQILHLVQSVRLFGPLWATSTFNFESMNGLFRNLMPGPREPLLQIAMRYQLFHNLHHTTKTEYLSPSTLEFMEKLISVETINQKMPRNIVIHQEINGNAEMRSYNQYIYNKICFCTHQYAQKRSRNDAFVEINEKFYRITNILESTANPSLYLVVKAINIKDVLFEDFYEYEMTEENKIFRIDARTKIKKCVNIEYNDRNGGNKAYLVIIKHYLLHD